MQTADCRPEEKCRPRRSREIPPKIAKIVAMIAIINFVIRGNQTNANTERAIVGI